MATTDLHNTRETPINNQIEREEDRTLLWTVLALVVLAILAYAAYAAYYSDSYVVQNEAVTMESTTTPTTTPY